MAYIDLDECEKVTLEDLRDIVSEARGQIDMVYAHWTAGHYSQAFDDYHILIDHDGSVYITTRDMTELKYHTWHRNSRAIGIAMMCAYGAEANDGYDADLGYEAPTDIQITALSQVTAVLSQELGLPITKDNFMTHCEAALEDGYGVYQGDPDLRWDLWYLPDPNNNGYLTDGGELWRGIANFYKNRWENE